MAAKAATKKAPKGAKAATGAKTTTGAAAAKKAATAQKAAAQGIQAMAQRVQKLTEEKAHQTVQDMIEGGFATEFQLGGALAVIRQNEWYGEHDTFEAYVENEHGFSYRKAHYLVATYDMCVECGITDAEADGVTWTKLKELRPVLTTKNKKGWLKKAANMTFSELVEAVRAAKGSGDGDDAKGKEKGTTDAVRFKVTLAKDQAETLDQALERAKQEGETDYDSVALEYVCTAYLSAPAKGKKPTKAQLVKILKEVGPEPVLDAVDKAFPDLNLVLEEDDGDEDPDEEEDEDAAEEEDASEEDDSEEEEDEDDEGDDDEDDDEEEDEDEEEDDEEEDEDDEA